MHMEVNVFVAYLILAFIAGTTARSIGEAVKRIWTQASSVRKAMEVDRDEALTDRERVEEIQRLNRLYEQE